MMVSSTASSTVSSTCCCPPPPRLQLQHASSPSLSLARLRLSGAHGPSLSRPCGLPHLDCCVACCVAAAATTTTKLRLHRTTSTVLVHPCPSLSADPCCDVDFDSLHRRNKRTSLTHRQVCLCAAGQYRVLCLDVAGTLDGQFVPRSIWLDRWRSIHVRGQQYECSNRPNAAAHKSVISSCPDAQPARTGPGHHRSLLPISYRHLSARQPHA